MSDMLVLTRDRRTGGVVMSVEVQNSPAPLFRPGPIPPMVFFPPAARSPSRSDNAWFEDVVMEYVGAMDAAGVEGSDGGVMGVNWPALRADLAEYLRAS